MENIEKILEEIFKVDPTLKEKSAEVRKIVISLLENKPEVKINEEFINGLKNILRAQFHLAAKSKPSPFFGTFNYKLVGGLLVVLGILITVPVLYEYLSINNDGQVVINKSGDNITIKSDDGVITKDTKTNAVIAGFVKFKSETEYKEYLKNQDDNYYGERMLTQPTTMSPDTFGMESKLNVSDGSLPYRVSETNVQVAGIDEPDIVKTDGKEIYFSSQNYYYGWGTPRIMPESIEDSSIMPPEYRAKIQTIRVFPPADLAKDGVILDKTGNLLLSNNVLVVLGDRNISGFDVTDPKNPKEKWGVNLDDKNSLVQARLYNDKIYLITSTYANRYEPCPIPLFARGEEKITVMCDSIYHPLPQVSADATYHISTINVANGELSRKISFVGSYASTVYMSKDNLFVAYTASGDIIEFIFGLMNENKDLFPQTVIDRVAKLKTYDISQESKINEMERIVSDYTNSLNSDDELKLNNEMENRANEYLARHKRELSKTEIVKMAIKDLSIESVGTIPGRLLNQFSLDEYNGYLRTAVTVGEFFGGGFGNSRDQENDVYVLDGNLDIVGFVVGLGQDEKIYSARFIEDKGYLVTFRQTDPFYVLDLKNPKSPKMAGELKIPGFSSYLHPLTKNLILGVGMENSKVKLSFFDVSNPSDPKEISKYSLDEYWTEVSNNYHAFLQDEKHRVFFLPGGNGGYIFSYENNEITMKKAVSEIQAKRALFIDDYLYIVGENKIVVLDENNWERINDLDL